MFPNNNGWEIIQLDLTDKQKDFLSKHDICVSDAYIGLLRAYKNNQTIWQSGLGQDTAWDIKYACDSDNFDQWDKQNKLNLKNQCHNWINGLILMNELRLREEFKNNYHLLIGNLRDD